MSNVNLFEQAARLKYRFPSERGELTVENLFDMPLTRSGGFDLDTTARTIARELKEMAEESFVETKVNKRKVELEAKLEIIRHIITVKLDESKAVEREAEKRALRQKLLAVRESKEAQALSNLSIEDIDKQLAALGN